MGPEQASSFGERLRRLRESAGLTQEELAFEAGLTPTAVSDLERGKTRRPYPHTVRSLADALKLSREDHASLVAAVPKRGGGRATPAAARASVLPIPPTPLLGRERELKEVTSLLGLSEVRLVTLTGIGGVGKTRLALEATRAALAEKHIPDGGAFIALAPLRDPGLVVSTIARSLGLREEQGQSPHQTLHAYLRGKRLLLVLDNFEHLLGAAQEVTGLVEACPSLVVLATSRAPLRVRGEHEYPVPPLALPSSTHNPTKQEVLRTPSGRLFAERARAASPSFALTTENAPSVAAICWRLAGLPLALELAAAKARLLEPQALLSRLDQALSTAWARDLPERQRTMRATLDWSHDLLSEPERKLYRRLSVFVGGFTLEAAEAVGAIEKPEGVLGQLGALVEQSLVVVQPPKEGGESRYGMLEPVRQYALEKLEQSRDSGDAHRKHTEFFLRLAERAEPELQGGRRQAEWLERFEREHDNFRAAFSWALGANGDARIAARLCWALKEFVWVRGYHREGRRWAQVTLQHDLSDALRARALHLEATMAFAQGDYPAAGEGYGETVRLSRSAGDMLVEGAAVAGTGLVEMVRQDYEAATSRLEEAIALFERCGDDSLGNLLTVRVILGTTLLLQGEDVRAKRTFEEGLATGRRLQVPSLTYIALYNLSQLALARGDLVSAAGMLKEGLDLSGQTKDRANLAHFLQALAAVEAFRGEMERSASLIGAAEGSLREVGAPVYNFYRPDPSFGERAADEARAVLGEAAFEEAQERGRSMTFEQAVDYALGREEPSPT